MPDLLPLILAATCLVGPGSVSQSRFLPGTMPSLLVRALIPAIPLNSAKKDRAIAQLVTEDETRPDGKIVSELITSNQGMFRTSGFDLGVAAQASFGLAKFKLAASYSRQHSHSFSQSRIAYRYQSREVVGWRHVKDYVLKPGALVLLNTDKAAFDANYGSHYVSDIEYGALLDIVFNGVITKEGNTDEVKNS